MQWMVNGSDEIIGEMTLIRNSLGQIVISQPIESSLSSSATYVAEAVGVENDVLIDTLKITTNFIATGDLDCIGEKNYIF